MCVWWPLLPSSQVRLGPLLPCLSRIEHVVRYNVSGQKHPKDVRPKPPPLNPLATPLAGSPLARPDDGRVRPGAGCRLQREIPGRESSNPSKDAQVCKENGWDG